MCAKPGCPLSDCTRIRPFHPEQQKTSLLAVWPDPVPSLTWTFFKPLFCVLPSLHWSYRLEFSLHPLIRLFIQFQSSPERGAQNKLRTVTSWLSSATAAYMTIVFGHLISTVGPIFFHYPIIIYITISNKHLQFCVVRVFCFVWFCFLRAKVFPLFSFFLFILEHCCQKQLWNALFGAS